MGRDELRSGTNDQLLQEIQRIADCASDEVDQSMGAKPTILIVEPRADVQQDLADAVNAAAGPFPVRLTAVDGLRGALEHPGPEPCLAVIARRAPSFDGFEVAARLRARYPDTELILHGLKLHLSDAERARALRINLHAGLATVLGLLAPLLTCALAVRSDLHLQRSRELARDRIAKRFGDNVARMAGYWLPAEAPLPSFAQQERDLIETALRRGGSVKRAAELLGMSRKILARLVEDHDLCPPGHGDDSGRGGSG